MSAVISISTGKAYGVCRVRGPGRASVYRDLRPLPAEPAPRRRPGPRGPMSDADPVGKIKQVITDSKFHGEGHRKIRARLRCKGIRTSKARVLRLMRENGLCAKPCHGPAHGPRAHDGTIIPDNIDEMWGTDMTGTIPGTGRQVAVFIAVDHCPAGCVGIHAAIRGTRFEALQPIRQGVRECFGAIGKDVATGLTIRHDNGSQYISHDFRNEIAGPGAKSSPSLVRAPEGNGCAERFIRTLKENLLRVRTFDTIGELQPALQKFKEDYNEEWLIQRHGHRSPNQFRCDAMDKIQAAA